MSLSVPVGDDNENAATDPVGETNGVLTPALSREELWLATMVRVVGRLDGQRVSGDFAKIIDDSVALAVNEADLNLASNELSEVEVSSAIAQDIRAKAAAMEKPQRRILKRLVRRIYPFEERLRRDWSRKDLSELNALAGRDDVDYHTKLAILLEIDKRELTLQQRIKNLLCAGKLAQELGQQATALECYEKSERLLAGMDETQIDNDVDIKFRTRHKILGIQEKQCAKDGLNDFYGTCLEFYENSLEDLRLSDSSRGICLDRLRSINFKRGKYIKASEFVEKHLQKLREELAVSPGREDLKIAIVNLKIRLNKLADGIVLLDLKDGDLSNLSERFLAFLVKKTKGDENVKNRVVVRQEFGRRALHPIQRYVNFRELLAGLEKLGKYDEALDTCRAAIGFLENENAEKTEFRDLNGGLFYFRDKLLGLKKHSKKNTAAEILGEERFYGESANDNYLHPGYRITAFGRLAGILEGQGRMVEARDTWDRLGDFQEGYKAFRDGTASSYANAARIQRFLDEMGALDSTALIQRRAELLTPLLKYCVIRFSNEPYAMINFASVILIRDDCGPDGVILARMAKVKAFEDLRNFDRTVIEADELVKFLSDNGLDSQEERMKLEELRARKKRRK